MTSSGASLVVSHGGPSSLGLRETPKGLILPEGMDFRAWLELGAELVRRENRNAWRIADWAFFGEGEYGQKYETASVVTGLAAKTLRNYAAIGGRFGMSLRRDNLSIAHHSLLVAMTDEEAARWLDLAKGKGWSYYDLRDALVEEGILGKGTAQKQLVAPSFRFTFTEPERVQTWTSAAERRGVTLEEFAVQAMDEAARAVLGVAA